MAVARSRRTSGRYDVVVVGGGHNGLVAAAYLARAGYSVVVLERLDHVGGLAVSDFVFDGVPARLSRYSYLVSLLPETVVRDLGLRIELRSRRMSSYTPVGDGGLIVDSADIDRTRASFRALTGGDGEFDRWRTFYGALVDAAQRIFPTMTEPLRSRAQMRGLVDDSVTWDMLVERPLGTGLRAVFGNDTVRGVVLTDALIGTFAGADDAGMAQNRCFLYHVIGRGSGEWRVPVGGMGAVSAALAEAAIAAGAEIRTGAEVVGIDPDGEVAVRGRETEYILGAGHVVANVAPAAMARLMGRPAEPQLPEGAQLKVNMMLSRLPRLRDDAIRPEEAFAGTFHVHEGYAELEAARVDAEAGRIPELPPCEMYCHSLTDDTILDPPLRARGAHTLTLFGLHMPARLFRDDPDAARQRALAAVARSVDSVLAEPLADCLMTDRDGRPCVEARTPVDLERELALPGGHIFHGELAWPFTEGAQVGSWGVETGHGRVLVCGAGARRGGGVSGIGGHNAAMAILTADDR